MNIYTSMHGIAKRRITMQFQTNNKYLTVLRQVAHLLSTLYIRCVLMGI